MKRKLFSGFGIVFLFFIAISAWPLDQQECDLAYRKLLFLHYKCKNSCPSDPTAINTELRELLNTTDFFQQVLYPYLHSEADKIQPPPIDLAANFINGGNQLEIIFKTGQLQMDLKKITLIRDCAFMADCVAIEESMSNNDIPETISLPVQFEHHFSQNFKPIKEMFDAVNHEKPIEINITSKDDTLKLQLNDWKGIPDVPLNIDKIKALLHDKNESNCIPNYGILTIAGTVRLFDKLPGHKIQGESQSFDDENFIFRADLHDLLLNGHLMLTDYNIFMIDTLFKSKFPDEKKRIIETFNFEEKKFDIKPINAILLHNTARYLLVENRKKQLNRIVIKGFYNKKDYTPNEILGRMRAETTADYLKTALLFYDRGAALTLLPKISVNGQSHVDNIRTHAGITIE